MPSFSDIRLSASTSSCRPLKFLPPGRVFRIVRVNASSRLARQLMLLGLCEDTTGQLLQRTPGGGVIIEHQSRRLCLKPEQAARISVEPG